MTSLLDIPTATDQPGAASPTVAADPVRRLVFSVDLEDYFHVSAFEGVVRRDQWGTYPSRVVASTHRLLDLFDETGTRATFFVLGWVAEREPALIREVAARGHEVASHSYWHRRVTTLSPAEFREDVAGTRDLLEQLSGQAVTGFRAPSFSITPANPWAFEVLVEAGYRYDSSVFPIRRRGYGFPGAPRNPYVISTPSGPLDEYPMATRQMAGVTLPAAGGGYLRHLPFRLIEGCRNAYQADGGVGVFYIHPWEVDPDQPRLPVGTLTRWRHYNGLDQTVGKLQRLLRGGAFGSIAALRTPPQAPAA